MRGYHSPDNGSIELPEYDYRLVPLDDVLFDHSDGVNGYQRPVKEHIIRMIERNYNPRALGAPTLAERKDGTLHCVDGQQRITFLRRKGVKLFPCVVFRSSGQRAEAGDFGALNTSQKITPLERFHADVAAGDAVARSITSAMHAQGFWISGGPKPANCIDAGGSVRCVKGVQWVYEQGGRALLEDTMQVIAQSWPSDEYSRGEIFIKGVAAFLIRYGSDRFTIHELSEAFSRRKPDYLESAAIMWNRKWDVSFGGDRWKGMAATLVAEWNSKRKTRKLPSYRPEDLENRRESSYRRRDDENESGLFT